ncbi:hypothetical protein BCR34DRAFT_611282, partial [Clohesyomyces aquaticus]
MAPAAKPLPADGPKIVLGIDYGTTFTGLAWAQTTGDLDKIDVEKVHVFRKWPERDELKVPSAISFSESPEGRSQWGFDIDVKSKVFKWTKMQLTTREPIKELKVLADLINDMNLITALRHGRHTEVPDHLRKSSEDVLEEYMEKVSREWYFHMTTGGIHMLDQVPLDMVITHPVGWSYEALNKTYRAIMAAFPKRMYGGLRNVYMTTEAEACSTYTVQELLHQHTSRLIKGDCFILCDAGGGTVDVASYVVESLRPLKLTKMGSLKGDECGAIFIDQAFLKWCQQKLKRNDLLESNPDLGGHFVVKEKGRYFLEEFEKHKHVFSGSETADIELPDDMADETGMIPISASEMREMFAKSVKGTVEMIQGQYLELRNIRYGGARCNVSTIFLAGGLSANPYLVKEVKAFAARNRGITVSKANDGWSAVVRGAVLTGAGVGTSIPPKVGSVPRYYGLCIAHDQFRSKHTGRSTVSWLIKQGDLILPNKTIRRGFPVVCYFTEKSHQNGGTVRITYVAARADDEPPATMSEVSRGPHTIKYMDIPLELIDIRPLTAQRFAEGRGRYYSVQLNVEICLYGDVRVFVDYKGKNVWAE